MSSPWNHLESSDEETIANGIWLPQQHVLSYIQLDNYFSLSFSSPLLCFNRIRASLISAVLQFHYPSLSFCFIIMNTFEIGYDTNNGICSYLTTWWHYVWRHNAAKKYSGFLFHEVINNVVYFSISFLFSQI